MPTDPDQLLCVKEVAHLLCVSPQSVKRSVRRGQLVCVRVGRLMRFRREDIQAYVRSQRVLAEQKSGGAPPARTPGRKEARS